MFSFHSIINIRKSFAFWMLPDIDRSFFWYERHSVKTIVECVRNIADRAELKYWEKTYYSATFCPPHIQDGIFCFELNSPPSIFVE